MIVHDSENDVVEVRDATTLDVQTIHPLCSPRGVCIDDQGIMFITDIDLHCVLVCSTEGEILRMIGRQEHLLCEPHGICVYAGLLYVADGNHDRIVVFRCADGAFVRSIGSFGHSNAQLCCPRGVSIANELLFVADSDNHRVVILTLQGELIRHWGSYGAAEGQFNCPWGLHCDGRFVFVADTSNKRLQVFSLEGVFLTSWACPRPYCVCSSGDLVYVGHPNGLSVFR